MLKKWKLAKSSTPSTSTSSPTRSPKTARGIAIPTTDSSCKEGRGNRAPPTRPASRTFRPSAAVQSRRRPRLRWLARGATDASRLTGPVWLSPFAFVKGSIILYLLGGGFQIRFTALSDIVVMWFTAGTVATRCNF